MRAPLVRLLIAGLLFSLSLVAFSPGSPISAPEILADDQCAALLGGAACAPGDANCSCANDTCTFGGCNAAQAQGCTANGNTCLEVAVVNQMQICGQVNTLCPNPCSQTTSQTARCAAYWTCANPPPSGLSCNYPSDPSQCRHFGTQTACGANLTTCTPGAGNPTGC